MAAAARRDQTPQMRLFTALLVLTFTLLTRSAGAQPPDPDLLARVAVHAEAIEKMRTHASYLLEGELDSLDSDGNVEGVKKMTARVVGDGERARLVVLKCTEDGKDATE